MKCFKVEKESEQFFDLNVPEYERQTDKKSPFFPTIQEENRYFAYCPGCSNTIQIINLYSDKKQEENGEAQAIHGRHYPYPLASLGEYDQEAYENCPFSKPSSFSGTSRRGEGKEARELLSLLLNHADTVYSFCRTISGINLSEPLFQKMLRQFKQSEGIYYRHVSKFNLPYAFLYMAHNQSIAFQYLDRGSHTKEFIEKNSKFFEIKSEQIRPKNQSPSKPQIYMYFADHKVKIHNDEPLHKMTMVIKEECDGVINTISEREITFNNYLFYRTICKNDRLNKLASEIFK